MEEGGQDEVCMIVRRNVKIPFEKEEEKKEKKEEKNEKKKTESAALPYSGGAFAGYALVPVPAPVSPIVANEPAEPH